MDRREFLEKAALIGAAPFVPPSALFASSATPAPDPIAKSPRMSEYDATIIRPLLLDVLESFVPELERLGYYTWFDDRYPHLEYTVHLRVAWDPVMVKTTQSSIDATYVIDCGCPSLMVSLSPYRSNDSYYSVGWKRRSMEEFVVMCQTADRAPILAQVLEKLKEPGRVPEWCAKELKGNWSR